MKDVHAMAPSAGPITLHRVGVSGVRKPINVHRPDRAVTLSAEFDVHVDLPSDRKGSDLSRNAELLTELVDATVERPVPSLESACLAIARELLGRHPSALEAEVGAQARYFLSRGVSPERKGFEDYELFAGAHATRAVGRAPGAERWSIGGEVVGMTVCPCAMEGCRTLLEAEFPELASPALERLPIISHNQRNRTSLSFELGEPVELEVDRIIEAAEAAQSGPTYAILKRGDEARVVLDAYRNPKFAEDVLRDLLSGLPARFPRLPDSAIVSARTRSEESIHKYDVTASHRTTLGELRGRRPA